MADDRIRIDALDPTVLPSLLHELPAMKDGLTVKLTVAQLRAVMLGGADNVALALKDLSNTTGPRGVRGLAVSAGADCNDFVENGFWVAVAGTLNTPTNETYLVRVECASTTTNWLTQFARLSGTDSSADSKLWKRERNNGVWGSWYRLRENEAELDARYLQETESNASGRDILLNASTLGAILAKIADAAAGQAALGVPPSPKTSAGLGQLYSLNLGANTPSVLPAGGTWFWFSFSYATSGSNIGQGVATGVDAGGTTIKAAISTQTHTGYAWRIA